MPGIASQLPAGVASGVWSAFAIISRPGITELLGEDDSQAESRPTAGLSRVASGLPVVRPSRRRSRLRARPSA